MELEEDRIIALIKQWRRAGRKHGITEIEEARL